MRARFRTLTSTLSLALCAACAPEPTSLTYVLDLDGPFHSVDVWGRTDDGAVVFPSSRTNIPAGTEEGTITVLIADDAPLVFVASARGLTEDATAESRWSDEVKLTRNADTIVLADLTAPVPCANKDCGECGDGVLGNAESCDDGGTAVGDGCDAQCRVESDFVCSGEPSACVATIDPPRCGDGRFDAGEACDDGNLVADDGCNNKCEVEDGYTCVGQPSRCATIDGPDPDPDPPRCGDGSVDVGEACDDGSTHSGDGCSNACAVEAGFACEGTPSVCVTVCGDGIVMSDEGCDDGNVAPNDGCEADCTVAAGYECAGEPSICTRDCSEPCGNSCPASGCCTIDCDDDEDECKESCPENCECSVDCRGVDKCDIDCKSGSSCYVDCDGAEDCHKISCRSNANCLIDCGSAERCAFDRCEAARVSCPNGEEACGASCP